MKPWEATLKIVRIAGVGALFAATLAFVGLGDPAAGSPAETAPPPQPTEVDAHEANVSTQSVRDYWTPERLAAAEPADIPTVVEPETDTETPPSHAVPDEVLSEPVVGDHIGTRDHAPFSYNTGHLYFTDPRSGGVGRCSASSINSNSRRLVLTAGHCVHAGNGSATNEGTWFTNVMFVPGYWDGEGVAGEFIGTYSASITGWTRGGNHDFDIGMVVVAPNSSGSVVDAVGGHGLRTSPNQDFYTHIVGYPSNRDGGERQWTCWGTASWFTVNQFLLVCDWEGGSSGSPWLTDYGDNGYGYATSVMSRHDPLTGANTGPFFGQGLVNLWNHMKDRT